MSGIGLFIMVDSLFEKEVQNCDDSQRRQNVPVEEKDCNGDNENNENGTAIAHGGIPAWLWHGTELYLTDLARIFLL